MKDCPTKETLEDQTWEFEMILQNYANRNDEDLREIYAKSIILTAMNTYGIVFVIDDFIDDVKSGFYIDYDGIGYALDKDGNEICSIRCNLESLKKLRSEGALFVAWYNK